MNKFIFSNNEIIKGMSHNVNVQISKGAYFKSSESARACLNFHFAAELLPAVLV